MVFGILSKSFISFSCYYLYKIFYNLFYNEVKLFGIIYSFCFLWNCLDTFGIKLFVYIEESLINSFIKFINGFIE